MPTIDNKEEKLTYTQMYRETLRKITHNIEVSRTMYPDQYKMYVFYYTSISKKMSIYDRVPMSFILDISDKGFSGVNIHFLTVNDRIKLYKYIGNQLKNPSNHVITHHEITTFITTTTHWKDAYRRYSRNGLRSALYEIPVDEMEESIRMSAAGLFEERARQESIHRQIISKTDKINEELF